MLGASRLAFLAKSAAAGAEAHSVQVLLLILMNITTNMVLMVVLQVITKKLQSVIGSTV